MLEIITQHLTPVNLALSIVAACLFYLVHRKERQFPNPPGIPVLGNIFQVNLYRYTDQFVKWHSQHGDSFEANFLHFNCVDTVDPKLIREVIHGQKRDDLYKYTFGDVMGKRSVILVDGPLWKAQRKLLNPLFSAQSLHKNMVSNPGFIEEPANQLVYRLASVADSKEPHLMDFELARVSLAVIGNAVLSYDFDYTKMKVGDPDTPFLLSLWTGIDEYNKRMTYPLRKYINLPAMWKFHKTVSGWRNLVKERVNMRKEQKNLNAQGEKYTDCLGAMVDSLNEDLGDGIVFNDNDVEDNIVTLLLAGHETTAHALSFTLYEIARNPEVEKKLIETLDRFGKDRKIEYNDFADGGELFYVGQVVNELLRTTPVAPSILRKISKGHQLGDVIANQDYNLSVTLPQLHHDPRYWESPEKFDPERFGPEKSTDGRTYLPFGAGPRGCLGKKLALLELKFLLATLYRNFTFELVPDFKYEVEITVTMHETHNMPLFVKSRHAQQEKTAVMMD